MPTYRVWYRNNAEPLEFVTESRYSDEQILDRILAQENIIPFVIPPAGRGEPGAAAPTLKEVIARNNLAPVRYTEDESEINNIE
jgi:hypothetical protein